MKSITFGVLILLGISSLSGFFSCKADERQDAIAAFTYSIDSSNIITTYEVDTFHPDPMNIDSIRIDTNFRLSTTKVKFRNASLNAAEFIWNFGDGSGGSTSTDTTVYHNYGTKDNFQIPNKEDIFIVKLSVGGFNGTDISAQKVIIK